MLSLRGEHTHDAQLFLQRPNLPPLWKTRTYPASLRQGKPKQAPKTPEVDVDVEAYEDVLGTLEVHNVRKQSNNIIWVHLDVDGTEHRFGCVYHVV